MGVVGISDCITDFAVHLRWSVCGEVAPVAHPWCEGIPGVIYGVYRRLVWWYGGGGDTIGPAGRDGLRSCADACCRICSGDGVTGAVGGGVEGLMMMMMLISVEAYILLLLRI